MNGLVFLDEPPLVFRHGQTMLDPRDGLSLFGPLDEGKPYGIRWGLIGPPASLERFVRWVKRLQAPISGAGGDIARPPFPGFEAAFNIPWASSPAITIAVEEAELKRTAFLDDAYQRVYTTVDLFSNAIINALKREEVRPDIWCVVIPEYVYKNCRPQSRIASGEGVSGGLALSPSYAKGLDTSPSLFEEENLAATPYWYDLNFHHQLKERLLRHDAPTQIVRETTIAHRDFLNKSGEPVRKHDNLQSAIAWHISTAVFYKAGGRPWKISTARDGVCYVGLVFKNYEKHDDPRTACCAAQMFMDSGDGVVFKGAVGPWYQGKRGHYHLTSDAAQQLLGICIASYKEKHNQSPPRQLFIHGRVRFNDEEWDGFTKGAGSQTQVVGVRIREDQDIKLFRKGDNPPLRGIALALDDRRGSLWTRGFVPRLRTYPGREVPNPLFVEISRGDEDIKVVLKDILSLTKLNYNACLFADGVPVTLKFADAVGEILTVGPMGEDVPPLPFKHYI